MLCRASRCILRYCLITVAGPHLTFLPHAVQGLKIGRCSTWCCQPAPNTRGRMSAFGEGLMHSCMDMQEQFNQTPTDDNCADIPQPLAGVAPDTPVMMYCTGGIRCDIYSAYLRQKGFNNLYTLEGGIANFLRQLGPADVWRGSMFTFDNRLALAPGERDVWNLWIW